MLNMLLNLLMRSNAYFWYQCNAYPTIVLLDISKKFMLIFWRKIMLVFWRECLYCNKRKCIDVGILMKNLVLFLGEIEINEF